MMGFVGDVHVVWLVMQKTICAVSGAPERCDDGYNVLLHGAKQGWGYPVNAQGHIQTEKL